MKLKNKNPLAVDRHVVVFANTPFAKCAFCSGCAASMNSDGTMNCSKADKHPVAVTGEDAALCDGKKPRVSTIVTHGATCHHVHPVFRRAAQAFRKNAT